VLPFQPELSEAAGDGDFDGRDFLGAEISGLLGLEFQGTRYLPISWKYLKYSYTFSLDGLLRRRQHLIHEYNKQD
jgi:hypothetical protein